MLPHLCLIFVQPPDLLGLAPTSPAGRATGIGGPGIGLQLQLPEVTQDLLQGEAPRLLVCPVAHPGPFPISTQLGLGS